MIRTTCSLFAFAGLALAQFPVATAPMKEASDSGAPVVAAMESSRAIDLVICLDVSGSMNGLINAARQNLWSIVNDMATLKPQPELRVALLTYGSPAYGGDTGFVSIQTELTTDLDKVSEKLFALKTSGGKEYVARVVKRSLDDLEWSKDKRALKLIFVCGNEAATQDPEFDAMQLASTAISDGVLVNTIYCGNQQKSEAEGWRQVARLADGKFAAIEQNQMAVIATPFDKELMDLSQQLNGTYLTFGRAGAQWGANQVVQDGNALSLNTAAAAQRCVTKSSRLYYNPTFDLCDAMKNPKFDLTAVKKEHLPKDLQGYTTVQLHAHVQETSKKRAGIQKKVADVAKKRDAFVLAERRKQAGAGQTLFEDAILESVRAQAASRGFTRPMRPEGKAPEPKQPKQGPPEAPVAPAVIKPPVVPAAVPAVPVGRTSPQVQTVRAPQIIREVVLPQVVLPQPQPKPQSKAKPVKPKVAPKAKQSEIEVYKAVKKSGKTW